MGFSKSKENFDSVHYKESQSETPEGFDKNAEAHPESSPENLNEVLEKSVDEKLDGAGKKVNDAEALMDERGRTLEGRLKPADSTDETGSSKKETLEEMLMRNRQLREEAKENYRVLRERASQIMSEARKTPRVDFNTGYSTMERYEKDVEAFHAGTEAWEAMMEMYRVQLGITENTASYKTPLEIAREREGQMPPRERVRAVRDRIEDETGSLNMPKPESKAVVDTRGEYRIPKSQLNRDRVEADAPVKPPEAAVNAAEKDKTTEKPTDSKIKFGGLVNNFVRQFGNGNIPQFFEEFINSNPSPEQYDTAVAKLGGVYRDFLKDGRLRGDKISEFEGKVREVATSLKKPTDSNQNRTEGAGSKPINESSPVDTRGEYRIPKSQLNRDRVDADAPVKPPEAAVNAAEKDKTTENQPNIESPQERQKKYKNYEAHKNSAERSIKTLQEVKNNFEESNDTAGALSLFENSIAGLTTKANDSDIEALRGQPIDLKKERELFDINDDQIDEYKRMRETQNSLGQGKSLKEVTSALEKQFGEAYGLQRIDLGKVKNLKELNAARIETNLSAEPTDDPRLVGQIKEIRGVGYNIPDVPQYDMKGEAIVGKFNKDVKARPGVIVYKARDNASPPRRAA